MHFQGQKGIAWLPVLGLAAAGAIIVIGGSVLYSDWQTGRTAEKNEISENDKTALRKELNKFFDRYQSISNCFAKVASVGDRKAYLKIFEETKFAKNPDSQGKQAEFNAGAIFLNDNVSELLNGDRANLRLVLWHELTHALEVKNWDRWSGWAFWPNRGTWKSRNERHTEYMEATVRITDNLLLLENQVREGKLTAEQIKKKMDLLEKDFKSGSLNDFQKVPKDLKKLKEYTGFDFDFAKIKELYKKGECLQFPAGVFEEQENISGVNAVGADKYVVWIATNATVGINVTTEKVYNTKEPSSGYSGGGLDPKHILEKKLLSGTRFNSRDSAMDWICSQLTDFIYAPLGIGWEAKYQGKDELLGNLSCPQQQ